MYGELLALGSAPLAIDAYAAQHPGEPGRRAEQSVAVHLAVLYLVFERGQDIAHASEQRDALTERPRPFGWLDPPGELGRVTVADVLEASCPEEHDARIRDWALNVWSAWAAHHETIRVWLD